MIYYSANAKKGFLKSCNLRVKKRKKRERPKR